MANKPTKKITKKAPKKIPSKATTKSKAKPKKKPKVGRPTKYTQRLADKICALLSEGQSMRTVCKDSKLPSARTLFYWLRTNEEFLQQYTRAKEESADALTDEMLDIADNATNDWMEKQGKDAKGYETNGENIQRSRLRIDTRKWLSSKLKPKKYGDRTQLDIVEKRKLEDFSDEELAQRIKDLEKK